MTEANMKERFPNQTHVQAGSEHVIWQLSGMARVDENEIFSYFRGIFSNTFRKQKNVRQNMNTIAFFHLIHIKDKNSLVNHNVKFEMEKIKFPQK